MSTQQVIVQRQGQLARSWSVSRGGRPAPGSLQESVRSPVMSGYLIILVFVVGFGLWAALAPLAAGAVASGVISPNSSRRVVQHLEGGIIRDLKVRDGSQVKAGDPLVVLEPVQPQSAHDLLIAEIRSLEARRARLVAERSGADTISFTPSAYEDGQLAEAAAAQAAIFGARAKAQASQESVLRQRIAQLQADITGNQVQIASVEQQIALINEEVEGKEKLLAQGLIPKPEALRLRRTQSELAARKSEFEAAIARTKQQIAETEMQIASADADRLDLVAGELDKIVMELADKTSRLRASVDVLNRTTITAPVDGTVINLKFRTVGGVLHRGEPVLEIVPNDDTLIVEAHVSPSDIRLIHPGQKAQIHLSAYSMRILPRIKGDVRFVSADRVTDPQGNQSYFVAKVEIDRADLHAHAPGIELLPGMPAEVIFVTEERTLLQYLLSPLTDVMRRGLNET
jgi:HlyD family secretion protein